MKTTVTDPEALAYLRDVGRSAIGEGFILDANRGPLPWGIVPDRTDEIFGYVSGISGQEIELVEKR